MRKEVKRSLVFWPAFVSATIILVSLLTATDNAYLASITKHARIAWIRLSGAPQLDPHLANQETPLRPADVPKDLKPPLRFPAVATTTPKPESTERMERGSRAMRVPDRIVDVFGNQKFVDTDFDFNELSKGIDAEKIIQPSREFSRNVSSLSSNMFHGDILAAERIATKSKIAADRAIGINTLRVPAHVSQTPPVPTIVETPKPALADQVPTLLVQPANKTPESKQISPARPHDPNWIDSQFYDEPVAKIELPQVQTPGILDPVTVAESIPQPTTDRPTVLPQSISNLAKVIPRQEEPKTETRPLAVADNARGKPTEKAVPHKMIAGPAAWPLTRQLNDQLVELTGTPARSDDTQFVSASKTNDSAAQWSRNVANDLAKLQSMHRLGDKNAGQVLHNLHSHLQTGYRDAENVTSRQHQIDWLIACHALNRRLAIWQPVYEVVSGKEKSYISDSQQRVDQDQLELAIKRVRQDLAETGDPKGWDRYLLLQELSDAMDGDHADQRSKLAQRLLSRLQWHGLPAQSQKWLQRSSVQEVSQLIQPWARNAVDYASLLSQIERHEADAIDMAAVDIAGAAQTLRFAEHPKAVEVADAIDSYYRNANVRMAINKELLRRMIPDVKPQTLPVRTNVLGSRVGGYSNINTDLDLDLIESRDRWMLTLKTIGNVSTQSVGRTDLSAITTRRDSNFTASTSIQITPSGALVGGSAINVQGATRLRGVNTRYDGWPLFGTLMRSVVASRYEESSGLTGRIANRKLKNQLSAEIDSKLNQKIADSSDKITRVVMGPLSGLKLDPKVVDMSTTENRLIARYRLAGDWQLGASTPRPRAPNNSLISLQINQTALNNILERLAPLDSPTTIDATVQSTMRLFGLPDTQLPEDIPRDITIQFSKTRPVTVEIEDGKVWVTMRIVQLSRAKGAKLQRFIVRALYLPKIDGLDASLVRDGHLRISGPGMSMRQRLPVRAIFNKVLAPSRSIPLTAPKIAENPALQNAVITQLELRDGWIALAIADRNPGRVATKSNMEPVSR